MTEKQAFPLDWPVGWQRMDADERRRASFAKAEARYYDRKNPETGLTERVKGVPAMVSLNVDQATRRVLTELQRMGVDEEDVVISTNIELRLDGYPKGGRAPPKDPAVAVYWRKGKQTRCMAVDRYDRVADNLAAIAATLDAMRAIERHGGAAILDRAFTGFQALPNPEQAWQVLSLPNSRPTRQDVIDAHRELAMKHHPDRGGDSHHMGRINAARDELLEDLPG